MAEQHLYLAVQRLNLGDSNWNSLISAMQSKGERNQGEEPELRNHWRFSLDETVAIFEAAFESTNIDEDWFTGWLSNEFSVDPGDITPTTGFNTYGRFLTIAYNAINRFRIGVFGFQQGQGWPDYEASRQATKQYITDNITEWEVSEMGILRSVLHRFSLRRAIRNIRNRL